MVDHHGDKPASVSDEANRKGMVAEKNVNLKDRSEAVKSNKKRKLPRSIEEGSEEVESPVGSSGLKPRKPKSVADQIGNRGEKDPAGSTGSRARVPKDPSMSNKKYLEDISENCHQCQRHDKGGVIRCKNCKRKRYCFPCASRWYPNLSNDDIAMTCPFCRKICNCKACLRFDKIDMDLNYLIRHPIYSKEEKQQLSKYLIPALLPHLKQLNKEQQSEKDIEAKTKGIQPYELYVQRADCSADERAYCDYCKTSLVDFHRSCSNCSFELCVACCRELRDGSIKKNDKECVFQYADRGMDYIHGFKQRKSVSVDASPNDKSKVRSSWMANKNGSIPCPPAAMGGCGAGILGLRCMLPNDTVTDVVNDAEMAMFIHELKDETKPSLKNCSCFDERGCIVANNGTLSKAACREDSFDNYLYCPTTQLQDVALDHFQSHWRKGQPVVVRNVLEISLGLSWEPMVMWRAFRQMNKMDKDRLLDVTVLDCLDWQESTVGIHQFFNGYAKIQFDDFGWPRLLKLDDWPPSNRFEEMLPRHSAEFLHCLFFKEYTHPLTGYWNLATKLPRECLKPDLGPKMYIAYGVAQELERGDSVTKLRSDMTDAVYMMTHTTELVLNSSEWDAINKMKQRHNAQDMDEIFGENGGLVTPEPVSETGMTHEESVEATEGGAVWDVFRRQDVPKLHEYLKKHHFEFRHIHCNPVTEIVHPIHDQSLYLSTKHKKKLTEEYGIEPWTFTQKLGDAVFIPAGCPHQVRNVKSCTKVAIDFLSPESIGESLRLVEEFRQLPNNHEAKENKPEVKTMMVHAMKQALDDLCC
ncbi:unnamed protein product [Rhodiola kirilowii]